MGKLPWFPMYAQRFLTSRKVRLMTAEQVGVYVLLLCEEWEGGPLPNDETLLCKLSHSDWQTVCGVLKMCFQKSEVGWTNTHLETLRDESTMLHNARSRAGSKGAEARYSKGQTSNRIAEPKQSHSKKQRGHSIDSTVQDKTEQKEKPPSGVKRKCALAEDWKPNDNHRAIAGELGLNLASQVEAFRDHAAATGRLLVDWNAGFRTWLRKSNEFERPASPNFGDEDERDAARRAEARVRQSNRDRKKHEEEEREAEAKNAELKEYYDNLPKSDRQAIDIDVQARARLIKPHGDIPRAAALGCFAQVISERMQKGAA